MFYKAVTFALLYSCSLLAQADIAIDYDDILGIWSIDAESIHRNGEGSRRLESTWEFHENGIMTGESIDSQQHARIGKIRAKLNYKIENGKMIRQAAPGRSKQEVCTAVEKTEKTMVLKCSTVYFFMTKH